MVRNKNIGCLAEAPIRAVKDIAAGISYSCCLGFRVPTLLCDMDRSTIWFKPLKWSEGPYTGNACFRYLLQTATSRGLPEAGKMA